MPIEILNYTLATAGHAGCGKSALIKAMLSVTPERAGDERSDGVDCDLAFAVTRLKKYHLSIVDVPGNAEAVGNMLSGFSAVDVAMLVIAADQGWMPQTEEHFQILNYLGIGSVLIALTKIDLVEDVAPVLEDITRRLQGTPLAEAPIMPVTLKRAHTVTDLREEISELISRTLPQRDLAKPRMAVDRANLVKGVGTIAMGTLIGGSFRVGQSVIVQPGGAKTQILGAKIQRTELQLARPGARIELNLSDCQPAVGCGDIITIAELSNPSSTIDVQLMRAPGENLPALEQSAQVCVHYGSGAVVGRLLLLEGENVPPGGRALARITLQTPVLALMHDRFVVRDLSQKQTLAGGVVLDPDPPRAATGPRAMSQLMMLQNRASSPPNPANFMTSQLARDGVGERGTFLTRSRFSKRDLDAATDRLLASKAVVIAGDIIADSRWWEALRELTISAIDSHHSNHPQTAGMPLTELRPAAAATLPPNVERLGRPLLDALLAELCKDDFVRTTSVIHRASHQKQPSTRHLAAGAQLTRLLNENPFDPPSRTKLCQSPAILQAMNQLIESGQAVDLAADVVMTIESYSQAVQIIRAHIKARGPATVSELKDVLASSRRVIVPLLTKMDRENITVREGDRRRLVMKQLAGPGTMQASTGL